MDINIRFIKTTLWMAAGLNSLGAYILSFPASPLGELYKLPAEVPVLYTTLLGYLILLFAGMYAWMATQPVIVRPLLYLGAIGKGGAFGLALVLWATGRTGSSPVMMLSADIVFCVVWLTWLARNRPYNQAPDRTARDISL